MGNHLSKTLATMGLTGGSPRRPSPAAPADDDLARLPPEMLDDVLSRLPADEVVRTSALSRAWRRRWESVPNLAIDLSDDVRCWDSAVAFLDRCTAPVHCVRIRGVPRRLSGHGDGWVRLVAGKAPRSLSLDLPYPDSPERLMLPSLFSCDTTALAELRLKHCGLPPPLPGFAGFHSLTVLDLDGVFFPDDGWRQLEAMIAAAPALDELRLAHVAFHVAGGGVPGEWVIASPKLRRLVLCLRMAAAGLWELEVLPKLEYADIFLNDSPADRDYVRLFTALSSAREIQIHNFDNITYQAAQVNIFEGLSCIFENLRILKLDTNFYEVSTIISSFFLLHKCPVLQVLEITDLLRDSEINAVAEHMLSILPNFGLVSNLERLYMNSISCSPNDMHFIKHVLRNARSLQLVSIDMFEESRKSSSEASRELKYCSIASPAARICLKRGDSCVYV